MAARGGHLFILRWLHDHGVSMCRTNQIGNTPLHEAALVGHAQVVQWLTTLGANLEDRNHKGLTCTHLIVCSGNVALLEWLYQLNPKCLRHRDRVVSAAFRHRATTTDNEQGNCALHYAASKGQIEMMNWLVDHGLRPSTRNMAGDTILHTATLSGSIAALDWARIRHISVQSVNGLNQTAVHFVAKHGNVHLLKWLLRHGAQRDVVDIHVSLATTRYCCDTTDTKQGSNSL